MTIEAGLERIALMGENLAKAVADNTENPGMFAVIERLIKALDRNTNTLLDQRGEAAPAENKQEADPAPDTKVAKARTQTQNDAATRAAEAKAAKKADPVAKAKIEYATLQQKGLDVIAKFGKEHFVAWLGERALSNLKQAHVDDYAKLAEELNAELAKEVEEELT